MNRFEKILSDLTVDDVAEMMADKYECNCEVCPTIDNWRECPAIEDKIKAFDLYAYSPEFDDKLSEATEKCRGIFKNYLLEEADEVV